MRSKVIHYLLITTVLFSFSACTVTPPKVATANTNTIYLKAPATDCEIRKWYNYQVVAISVINKRWLEKGISLKERVKKAYELRHNARINARFMMKDKVEVKKLQDRDMKKYGNPDGPTLMDLVKKVRSKGANSDREIYQKIIESSSRTSPMYNAQCIDK